MGRIAVVWDYDIQKKWLVASSSKK